MRWIKCSISAEGRWLGQQVRFLLRPLIANVVCIVVGSVLTLADPLIVKWLIDTAIPQRSVRLILVGAAAFCVTYLASLGIRYLATLAGAVVNQKLVFRIRSPLLGSIH